MGSRLGRRLGAAALVGLLLAASVPAPAGAGLTEYGVLATIGDPCLTIKIGTPGTTLLVQRRGGKEVARRSYTSPTGDAQCLKPLLGGDRIVVKHAGVVRRTVTVPRLKLTLDLAANTLKGTTPEGGSDYSLLAQDRVTGLVIPTSSFLIGTTEPDGSFGPWPTAPVDLSRGDLVDLAWYPTGSLDEWHLQVATRTLTVVTGGSEVFGTAQGGSQARVTLRSPAGVVRGRMTARASRNAGTRNTFRGMLRRNGAAVKVRAGDRVTLKGLSGSFTVPARTLQVVPSTGAVTATCPAGSEWAVSVSGATSNQGVTPDGAIAVPSLPGAPLAPGTIVELGCQRPSGYGILQVFLVP